MIQFAYTIIAGFIALFIINKIKVDPQLKRINKDCIYADLMIKYKRKNADAVLKRKITRNINILIKEFKYFKIGKTGNFTTRAMNYIEFEHMFILLEANYSETIVELENYYNEKYFDHPKNKNINKGSACKTVSKNGKHYLYIALS